MAFSVGGGGGGGAVLGGGTGTVGQIAKFTTTTEIDDSHITEDSAGITLAPAAGGAIYINAAAGQDIELNAGANTLAGGDIYLTAGISSGATGGEIDLYAGSSAVGHGADIGIYAGTGSTTGGNIFLTGGTGANAASHGYININGSLKFQGATSGHLTIASPATITDHTITWPSAQGAANTLLKNDGSGNLAWVSATVPMGGTGVTSATAYAVLCGGTTSTGAFQSIASVGTAGQPLVSAGAGALPAFGTALVAGGGTGVTSTTAYAVLCGGTTSTGALQSIASVGTSGQVLTSNGAGALPTFQTAGSGVTGSGTSTFIPQFTGSGSIGNTVYSINSYTAGGSPAGGFVAESNTVDFNRADRIGGTAYFGRLVTYTNTTMANVSGSTGTGASYNQNPEAGIQIGSVADESTVHYGIRSRDTAAFNNSAIGSFIIAAGRSSGTAKPTFIRLRAGAQGTASGSTLHTNVDRLVVNGTLGLSDNTDTTLAVFTLASGTMSGGIINYLVESSDGTDHQAECGSVVFSFVNKAAAYTTGITAHDTQNSTSSGTLTVTWSITTGSSLVNIVVNANSSLTPTTLRICYTLQNLGTQAITVS